MSVYLMTIRCTKTLIRVMLETNDHNGNNSNALRKYYEFSNGKRFPTLAEYKHT